MSGRSSADPDKLRSYSETGLVMAEDLRLKAQAVKYAIDDYNASGAPRPIDAALGDRALALAEKWRHLDEFVGDVATGFEAVAAIHQGPLHEGSLPTVLTFDDTAITAHGQVGYADREAAIAEAEALAADIRAALEADDFSEVPLAELVARAERGMYDPAFATTFATHVGVDGMVDLTQQIYETGGAGDDFDGVVELLHEQQLAPFAMILTTAMDTRADTHGSPRRDPDNANLPADLRLPESFVTEFVSHSGDTQDDLYYSVLVRESELPTDVLVRVGNHQLDDMLTTDNWRPNVASNIMQAIGDDPDASLQWLRSNDIDGDGGATNMELLLRVEHPHGPDVHGLGNAMAEVVDNGIGHADVERADGLFEIAVRTVASEDHVHYDPVRDVLAHSVGDHMDVIDRMINDGWYDTAEDGVPSDGAVREPSDDFFEVHDFLREMVEEEGAPDAVRLAVYEYVGDEMMSGLDTANADDRTQRLEEAGHVLGVLTHAEANAAIEQYEYEQAQDPTHLPDYVISWIPVADEFNDAIDFTTGETVTGHLFGPDGEPIRDVGQLQREALLGLDLNMASLATHAAYDAGAWSADEIIATTGVDFFTGQPGDADRDIQPYESMTNAEKAAYREWVFSEDVAGFGGGPARRDLNDITRGAWTATSPLLAR